MLWKERGLDWGPEGFVEGPEELRTSEKARSDEALVANVQELWRNRHKDKPGLVRRFRECVDEWDDKARAEFMGRIGALEKALTEACSQGDEEEVARLETERKRTLQEYNERKNPLLKKPLAARDKTLETLLPIVCPPKIRWELGKRKEGQSPFPTAESFVAVPLTDAEIYAWPAPEATGFSETTMARLRRVYKMNAAAAFWAGYMLGHLSGIAEASEYPGVEGKVAADKRERKGRTKEPHRLALQAWRDHDRPTATWEDARKTLDTASNSALHQRFKDQGITIRKPAPGDSGLMVFTKERGEYSLSWEALKKAFGRIAPPPRTQKGLSDQTRPQPRQE